ncbi:MAG: hypothetical protein ACR2IH_00505 [Pyrinomonadaceae bacterium]
MLLKITRFGAAFALLGVFAGAASAQFTITIPKIPKIKKTTQTTTTTTTTTDTPATVNTSTDSSARVPQASSGYEKSPAVDYHVGDIKKMQAEVEAYDPKEGGTMVHESNYNYVLYAVSKTAREKWLNDFGYTERGGPCDIISPALDSLAKAVDAKMASSAPSPALFKFRDAASEKVLMNYFKTPATIKVYKIGFDTAGWQTAKDDYGLPQYRYKDGNIYVRDTTDDQPYCHVYSARVKQDYAGAGTYSTEIYRTSAFDAMVGCPAGVK